MTRFIGALWLTLGPGAFALPGQERPVFPSGTQLVQVVVSVRNAKGEAIDDLRPEEFHVTDDGDAQSISFFQAPVKSDRTSPAATVVRGTGGAATSVSPPRLVQARHHVLIVLQPMRMDARRLAVRAVDRFLRGGSAAAYSIGVVDAQGRVQEFTSDLRVVLNTWDEIASRVYAPAAVAPLNDWMGPAVTSFETLSRLPGRKSMVVFVDFDVSAAHALWPDAALRANVALYPVDARGLVGVVPFGNAENAGVGSVGSWEAGPAMAADLMGRTSVLGAQAAYIRSIGEATGGRGLAGDNDLGKVFRSVEENSRGVYVLGYDLSERMANGRFHRVKVKVSRPGLEVRTTDGYYAPSS